jgi:hypothetical protein
MLKITFRLLIVFFVFMTSARAQKQGPDRTHLEKLLAERAKNFSEYAGSIQKRSGIFGNKTKRDIEKSNEVLMAIVTLDNDIMSSLRRTLDYKSYEKTSDNYNSRDCNERLLQSRKVTDTLMKQITILENKTKHSDSKVSIYKMLCCVFFAGCVALLILLGKQRRAAVR